MKAESSEPMPGLWKAGSKAGDMPLVGVPLGDSPEGGECCCAVEDEGM
jgi:hypothetical protein